MKITYLHQYFATPEMSWGTRSYEMARRLVSMGHKVHIITSDTQDHNKDKRDSWRQTTEAGICVHWISIPYSNSMSYRERILAFLKFAWHSAQRATQIDSDVV